uniref:Major facilitator superfamily (MFS) profile domain-containing protein n=1 Tax=Parascaris univalens TaxID=6257 RepID=A0A915A879_PARUN
MVTQGSAPTTFDELFKRAKKYGRYQVNSSRRLEVFQ